MKRSWLGVIKELKPDWLVLRRHEYEAMLAQGGGGFFRENYTVAKVFNVGEKLAEYRFLPGKEYFKYDSYFYVLKKTPAGDDERLPLKSAADHVVNYAHE
jgi:hypothetical protein